MGKPLRASLDLLRLERAQCSVLSLSPPGPARFRGAFPPSRPLTLICTSPVTDPLPSTHLFFSILGNGEADTLNLVAGRTYTLIIVDKNTDGPNGRGWALGRRCPGARSRFAVSRCTSARGCSSRCKPGWGCAGAALSSPRSVDYGALLYLALCPVLGGIKHVPNVTKVVFSGEIVWYDRKKAPKTT
jgi:hypothetical protein